MSGNSHDRLVGRGTPLNPANSFESVRCLPDLAQLSPDEFPAGARRIETQYLPDDAQSIVTANDSPDVGFRFSLNPYRGCTHGCSYCYARPSHEFLGLSAGVDFETKILVKHRAPKLFQKWLGRKRWKCEPIALSGVTDCYQGAEREFRLTRRCLEVALACRQPIVIITKNALVTRDLDLLEEMSTQRLIRVSLTMTSLDQELTRVMEPRTSSPQARLDAIRQLARRGVPTQVLLSPIIPGLNDAEIPALLRAARAAGALGAGTTMLRLPAAVRPIFLDWLERCLPSRKSLIESRIRQIRGGQLNDANFGSRMSGEGVLAEQIRRIFQIFAAKYQLSGEPPRLDTSRFRRPGDLRQRRLF